MSWLLCQLNNFQSFFRQNLQTLFLQCYLCISKRNRRGYSKPCSVVKLADTPSYLGGEENWDKLHALRRRD